MKNILEISVVIPTFNRYLLLKRALKSVFSQSYKPKEIIIIDDGSRDETFKIKDEFSSIRYFFQKNSGVSSARNFGIKEAKCDWIAFLDSDDTWHKDKLQKQVDFHQENPQILLSYTDELWIKDSKVKNIPKKYSKFGGSIFDKCLSHCIIAPSSSMIHKSIFNKFGCFDESLEVCEDYDLWLRVSMFENIGLINEKLITKYLGQYEQLGFKYWGMDRFRVKSLEKNYKLSKNIQQKNLMKNELYKKLDLLIKGAKKHNKTEIIQEYKNKIRLVNSIF